MSWLSRLWRKWKFNKAHKPRRRGFLSFRKGRGGITIMEDSDGVLWDGSTGSKQPSRSPEADEEPEDTREEVQPITIIGLLEEGVEVDLNDLDTKLDRLRERALFYSKTLERHVPRDIDHAIVLLEARKKYPKLEAHIPWMTTTGAKIKALCSKYRLDHQPIRRFLPDLPDNVVSEVEQFKRIFEAATKGITHTTPTLELSVIAAPGLFETRKGDPILLAKSPFGDFYYVLCAWDKEVDFVGDLLAEAPRDPTA